MTDYIEREAAIESFRKNLDGGYVLTNDAQTTHILQSIPAADVRPVVLCRDCKYYYKDEDGYEMCDNSECYDHVTEDGFCAWAERGRKADG